MKGPCPSPPHAPLTPDQVGGSPPYQAPQYDPAPQYGQRQVQVVQATVQYPSWPQGTSLASEDEQGGQRDTGRPTTAPPTCARPSAGASAAPPPQAASSSSLAQPAPPGSHQQHSGPADGQPFAKAAVGQQPEQETGQPRLPVKEEEEEAAGRGRRRFRGGRGARGGGRGARASGGRQNGQQLQVPRLVVNDAQNDPSSANNSNNRNCPSPDQVTTDDEPPVTPSRQFLLPPEKNSHHHHHAAHSEPIDFGEGFQGPPSPGSNAAGSGSRWSQLKCTIKMATALQGRRPRKASTLVRQDSFLKRFSTRHGGVSAEDEIYEEEREMHRQEATDRRKRERKFVIHPDENFMFVWLGILTVAVLYNLWTSIARQAFDDIQTGYEILWFCLDALCDFIYLMDIVVQLRTGYLEKGLIVYQTKKLARHYLSGRFFILDCICLLPLDLLQVKLGYKYPILRFPRFFKVYRSYRFSYMVETRTIFPNMWRVANLSHVLFLGSHWFAAFYFMISEAEDFEGTWGYPVPKGEFASVTRKYLKSLYWSTLTLTTIGDLPPPETNWE